MQYVFDADAFITLFTYFYESRFPSLWDKFNEAISNKVIISVREVYNEIILYHGNNRLTRWVKDNPKIFEPPAPGEDDFMTNMFAKVPHFKALISQKSILQGKPVADPLIIAKAKIINGSVVTKEKFKENAAKIPNVCKHFEILCYNLEEFMEKENWKF